MSSQPILLHGARTGGCKRVAIAFEEAGLAYTPVKLDLYAGEHLAPAHRALNPAGRVPTIVDPTTDTGPFILSQSAAILLYAAEKVPGTLLPTHDLQVRAIAFERFMYFVTDVIAVSHASFMIRKQKADAAQKLLDDRVLEMIAGAERFLEGNAYMAGETFTLADICAVTMIFSVYEDIDWTARSRLERWYETVMARPSVVKGLSAF